MLSSTPLSYQQTPTIRGYRLARYFYIALAMLSLLFGQRGWASSFVPNEGFVPLSKIGKSIIAKHGRFFSDYDSEVVEQDKIQELDIGFGEHKYLLFRHSGRCEDEFCDTMLVKLTPGGPVLVGLLPTGSNIMITSTPRKFCYGCKNSIRTFSFSNSRGRSRIIELTQFGIILYGGSQK